MKTLDLPGHTFGRLTALARDGGQSGIAMWQCKCTCGTVKRFRSDNLRAGLSTSCGCARKEATRFCDTPAATYDGLTLAEHPERSGVPLATVSHRARKYGHPFPECTTDEAKVARREAGKAERQRQRDEAKARRREDNDESVFRQDVENNRRTRGTRLGRAAAWHRNGAESVRRAPETLSQCREDRPRVRRAGRIPSGCAPQLRRHRRSAGLDARALGHQECADTRITAAIIEAWAGSPPRQHRLEKG